MPLTCRAPRTKGPQSLSRFVPSPWDFPLGRLPVGQNSETGIHHGDQGTHLHIASLCTKSNDGSTRRRFLASQGPRERYLAGKPSISRVDSMARKLSTNTMMHRASLTEFGGVMTAGHVEDTSRAWVAYK